MLKTTLAAVAIVFGTMATSQAASYNIAPVAVDPIVQKTGVKLSGAERLKRLMRPHIRYLNPITQSVKDATGDPNISVIDFRSADPYETATCHFFYVSKKKRVLKCD